MKVLTQMIAITTTIKEDEVFTECDHIIDNIIDILEWNNCDEMMSIETGEVITLDEFKRMRGILGGLPHMSMMYKNK